MPRSPLDELLDALTAALPALPGPACVGDPLLFDPRRKHETQHALAARQEKAITVCRGCEALTQCAQWLSGLAPADAPAGTVTAGIVVAEAKQPSDAELRRARMLELLAADPDATANSIAVRCGVDPKTVSAHRQRLAATG